MSGPPPRAPGRDGAVVARPPLEEVGALLAANRERLRRPDLALLGRPLPDLQFEARAAALEAAGRYLQERGEPVPLVHPRGLVVAGHQPDLFHPGVWVKNFALCGLRRHAVGALNFIVDNDTLKSTFLRLPAAAGAEAPWPHLARVPYDAWAGGVPYEERRVLDEGLFASFADRAGEVLRPWGYEPLLPAFWAEVRRRAARGVGEAFAGARRALERAWGCHNLELPLSALCATEPFAWFAAHLLAELPRFHGLYNAAVGGYRARHGIRNRRHPVPDLAAEGDWLEAPLWGWRAGQGRRGRLFARLLPDRVELRAGEERWPDLPSPRRPEAFVEAWRGLAGQGCKARTRALTTTLFARLLLADLFVHGIGGGKYDELTDELLAQFYGVEPPTFVVLTGTRWLPLPDFAVTPDDVRRLGSEARDVYWNPQRHLPPEAAAGLTDVLRAREAWAERRPDDAAGRRQRFQALRELTAALRAPLREREARLRAELGRRRHELAANAVLRRRDYAFCLYPEAALRPFCTQFL